MAFHLLLPLGPDASEVVRWLARLFTYCVHAALWAAAAALLARKSGPAAQNRLWRLALLGPIATTTLAALAPHWLAAADAPAGASRSVQLIREAIAAPWTARQSGSASTLGVLLAAACMLGSLRFIRALQLLGRALSVRTLVSDARLCDRLEQLRARTRVTRVRLSESARVPGPLIVGRAEICLPRGVLEQYSDEEVDAIFAHELAHLERRDGVWFPVIGLVEAMLWMQPLNRWLAARYRHSAELACDDRALQLTAAPMALARALTHMAELALRRRVLLPTMASDRSSRLERVQRLVTPATPRRERRAAWLALLALGALLPCLGVEAVRAHSARPDAGAYATQMHELDAQASELERQLAGARDPADVLELEQALRHVRETHAWTEHAFTGELEAWEQR